MTKRVGMGRTRWWRWLRVAYLAASAMDGVSVVLMLAGAAWLLAANTTSVAQFVVGMLAVSGLAFGVRTVVGAASGHWLRPGFVRIDRRTIRDLKAAVRARPVDVPLWDPFSDSVLYCDRTPTGDLTVDRYPSQSRRDMVADLRDGEPVSTTQKRCFVVEGRRVVAYDMVIPWRRSDDDEPEPVPSPSPSLRQFTRSRRAAAKAGMLATTPAEVRELAQQLRRAETAPRIDDPG